LAALLLPFALWGDPYPPEVARYWLWGTASLAAAVGVLSSDSAAAVRIRGWAARIGQVALGPSPGRFALIAAAVTASFAMLLAIYGFHRGASTSDELAMLWHAKMLVHGRLSLPVDPNREFFALENVVDTGRWYSQFPIGGPFVLAFGAAVGAPWIVNPLLLGGTAAAVYHFARRAFGDAQARVAVALLAVTPMVLIMAGTWMNHVPVIFLAAGSLAALAEWDRAETAGRRAAYAALIGLLLGLIATIRPLDAVAVSVATGVFQLFVIRREPRRIRELVIQALCGAIGVAPLLYANWATTGSPLTFGYDVSWGAGHRVGFHTDPYGTPHTIAHAADLTLTYVGELNTYLMAWPVPSLVVLAAALLAFRRASRWDALMIGLFAAQLAAYAAYWGDGEFLGPRFLYTALPALVVLLARTPFVMAERFGARAKRAAGTVLVCCSLAAWCVPLSAYSAAGLVRHVRGTRTNLKFDIAGAVRAANIHHAVVFLREPFSYRLARRLWGLGMPRSEAARLIATRDACSLLSAAAAAERDSAAAPAARIAAVVRDAAPFKSGPTSLTAGDGTVRMSSPASLSPECKAELSADAQPSGVPFGPALPLEPIDQAGRVDGDVVYVADLLDRNEVLRRRFGDRVWYRFVATRDAAGRQRATLVPY
jgi:4-amino-4-deoxy-L-arabinose transferase-like glycosyltransferase